MSTVLWCQIEGVDESPSDLGAMYHFLEILDALCVTAGVQAISSVIDNSDLEYNLSDSDEVDEEWLKVNAKWHSASDLRALLECVQHELPVRGQILGLKSLDMAAVADEIESVRETCKRAQQSGARVRLLAVM